MTKQPPSVSTLRLSRVCRLILTLGTLKLMLLGSMFMFPEVRLSDVAIASPDTTKEPKLDIKKDSLPEKEKSADLLVNTKPSSLAKMSAPAPNVVPSVSPFSQDLPKKSEFPVRPDEATFTPAPAPKVSPFVPRDSLQRKQEELNRREQELRALQNQMQSRLDELRVLEDKIQKMLNQANDIQDQKLTHLIDVYSNMKAKQAADVLASLDPRIAVKILSGMRGRQAGEILTYMAPEPAAKLSELLSRTSLP